MKTNKNNRRRLFLSVISLILCISMLLGTTLAWFTDSVSSTGNIIKSGRLKVAMHYAEHKDGEWKDASDATIFDGGIWEPGYSEMKFIKVSNTGNLAFSYKMHILPAVEAEEGDVDLAEVIDVYVGVVDDNFTEPAAFSTQMEGMTWVNTLDNLMGTEAAMEGILLPTKGANGVLPAGVSADTGDVTLCVVLHMQEKADNRYQNLTVGNNFTIQLVATQYDYEQDNFGGEYDGSATYPDLIFPEMMDMDRATAEVTPDPNNKLTEDVTLEGEVIRATVAAGTLLEEGATKLVLTVSEMDETTSNITLGEGEAMRSMDVHVSGLSKDNTVPVIISLGEVAPEYLNQGNLNLAHVENGQTVPMTRVDALTDLDAHNEYYYDILTGELTVAMATFSEVALVAEEAKWEGKVDHSWYVGKSSPYTIANADQLWSFSQIVGGMYDQTGDGKIDSEDIDSFAGKTVKLLADIDLNDVEGSTNDWVFYPIGYYNSEYNYTRPSGQTITSGLRNFEGTFDGNGHTISNFYQNTWEMKGDHDWYNTATEQYYRDGMGLFGRVYGGTVKNLTIRNFKSDGEITTTGCVAAYADFGATFENIAIFDCNPRVYNIGNGGIVGCVGWYTKGETDKKVTFKNITVDNSNKISALWGSYDVACGGLVGQYYPTSGQTSSGSPKNAGIHMENCHVAAQMDVYNDVCANYQYYAYRYAGMLIGSVRENMPADANGHVYPKMDGITASGCTVHFGTWNDYYYCEIIDNTTASYTHDYQMSRLTEIKAINGTTITYLDGTTGTVPASGRANYVIVDYTKGHGTENATCYHFKDGKVWNHSDAGTEIVDGKEVLVEDKQHLYLEFNNLITGYGWGVTSRGFSNLDGVTNLDVELGSQEESDVKFKCKLTAESNALTANKSVKIGDLFAEIEGANIIDSAVQVAVTALNESGITAEYKANAEDWTQGTLTFNKTAGLCKVTIQDYNFCKPTSFILKDGKLCHIFETLFTGNFLYRVGNENAVSLSSLFVAKVADISKVAVTIENVAGDAVGTYTDNAKWEEGTIQFSGTGVVKVTITDNDYCESTELLLEVVDAVNVTTLSDWKDDTTIVLLNEIDINSCKRLTKKNTLYGNGFTIDATAAPYSGVNYDYQSYVIYLENGNLDNVIIEGKVYPTVGGSREDDYNRALIMTNGDCKISNCFLSNTASPIRNGGNLDLQNSTLKGGAYANMDIRNGHVILDNVTTINQFGEGIIADNGKEVVGLGITVYQEGGSEELKITIRNNFTQYNLISKEQTASFEGDAKILVNKIFAITGNPFRENYVATIGGTEWVNTGILTMNNLFTKEDLVDERIDKGLYKIQQDEVTITAKRTCVLYSYKPTSGNIPSNILPEAGNQGAISPSAVPDFTNKNYDSKGENDNDYCYEDDGVV